MLIAMSNVTQPGTKRAGRRAALSNGRLDALETAARITPLPPYRLLSHESVAEFEVLYDSLRAALPPQEFFDEIQLYFLTDIAWKLRRFRACHTSLRRMIAKYVADPAHGPDSESVRLLSDTSEMDRSALRARREMVKMAGDLVGRRSDRLEVALRAIDEAICAPFNPKSQPRVARTHPVAYAGSRPVRRRHSSKAAD